MAISDKTRKILWGKSGNCCALCKQELIKDIDDKNTVVGEECHIISSKVNGPRHKKITNYDDYENLILMCPIHHKIIDEDELTYTEELLRMLKRNHEQSITSKIIKDKEKNIMQDIILEKSSNVRDLVRTIYNVSQYITDYPVECKDDYGLFQVFFDLVHNSDVICDYDEFDRIKIFDEYYQQLVDKGYCILLGRYEKFFTNNLDTAFVYIVTNKQYEDKKVNIKM